jgi:hypothetical protein
LTDSQGRPYKD